MRHPPSPATPLTLSFDSQLMQDYLQTAGILVNPAGAPAVAAFQNAAGQDEAVVIDVTGNLFHVCREPLSDSGWNIRIGCRVANDRRGNTGCLSGFR
jgi:hypothetical protein